MSETSGKLSVFNFERTITDFVSTKLVEKIGNCMLGNVMEWQHLDLSPKIEREAIWAWLKGRTIDDEQLDLVLEQTQAEAIGQLAPWARLIMEAEASRSGNDLCIISSTYPEPVVEAYADGWEETLDIKIDFAVGRKIEEDPRTRKFTGGKGNVPKKQTIQEIEADNYLALDLFAESFVSGLQVLEKAKRPLVVSGHGELLEKLPKSKKKQYDHLDWEYRQPDMTTLTKAGKDPKELDLGRPSDRAAFLKAFYGEREA